MSADCYWLRASCETCTWCQIAWSRAAAGQNKLYFLLTVARRTPESSMVRKNSVSTPAIFTKPAPTEQISTIAVKMEQKITSYYCLDLYSVVSQNPTVLLKFSFFTKNLTKGIFFWPFSYHLNFSRERKFCRYVRRGLIRRDRRSLYNSVPPASLPYSVSQLDLKRSPPRENYTHYFDWLYLRTSIAVSLP